ncbi:MAG: FAD-dependent oxidoreductase [Burkholderiales bacterium]|nr:FAD-dependent oxidoreductase [Burkholderiales bacterium]
MSLLQRIARTRDPVKPSRRAFLARTASLAAASALPAWSQVAPGAQRSRVVIVGGGLAGLAAAYELAKAGVRATLVEGSPRLGGRCWTERGAFADGQIAERGGELIDTTHEAIRSLCKDFELPLDDLVATEAQGSEPLFFFDGAPYTTADVDRDFAAVRPRLADDAKVLGDDLPTYKVHTAAQVALDRMSAAQWIDSRVPGGMRSRLGQLLVNAYGEELGGDPDEISAITVVSLLAGSPADRFSPYEESDQRYHIRGGNDLLVGKLAERSGADIQTHSRLMALSQRGDGRYRLVLLRDAAEREEIADRVIVAIPFTLLRLVDLGGAGFGARKKRSIGELGMGRNTKLQLQFSDRFWHNAKGNGEYRLRGSFQTTWEVTRAQTGAAGILNFFSGGAAAVAAGLPDIDTQARESLRELARYVPDASPAWNRRVIRNAWDRNPWSLGSYALLKPGQYTSFYGVEGERAGHVYFAGEHTSLDSQGYLNGAVESGQRAAGEVLASLGARRQKAA